MLNLQHITTSDSTLYSYVEDLLVQSFPDNEYRPLKQLREYTDHKQQFYNNVIIDNEIPVGVITYWDFETFFYVEHFAVSPKLRNGGYGQKTLELLCRYLNGPIILEVEIPDHEMARRRIAFYQRQGFALWNHPYQQPPYKPGDNYLPMLLMAYGNLQSDRDFERIQACIYREVYNCQ